MINILITEFIDPEALKILSKDFKTFNEKIITTKLIKKILYEEDYLDEHMFLSEV